MTVEKIGHKKELFKPCNESSFDPIGFAGLFYMNMQEEIWFPVIGYEGLYEVSNTGQVKSLIKRCRNKDAKILCLINRDKLKYKCINLHKDKKQKMHFVHRLVAKAFIPNPENKPYINHIDGNPENNNVTNLEWCTPSENLRHAFKIGKATKKGEKHHNTKLKDSDVLDIRCKRNEGMTIKEIAKIFNLKPKTVEAIIYRFNWKHI